MLRPFIPLAFVFGLVVAAAAALLYWSDRDSGPASTETPAPTAAVGTPAEAPGEPGAGAQSGTPAVPAASPETAARQPAAQTEPAEAPAQPESEIAAAPAGVSEPPAQAPAAPAGQGDQTAAPAETPDAAAPLDAPEAAVGEAGTAPTFDIVRIEPTGEALLAGRAAPGAEIEILLNGEVIATAAADAEGSFLATPDAALPPGSHDLSVRVAGAAEAAGPEQRVAVIVPGPGTGETPEIVAGEEQVAAAQPDGDAPSGARDSAQEPPSAAAEQQAASPQAAEGEGQQPGELESAQPGGPAVLGAPDAIAPDAASTGADSADDERTGAEVAAVDPSPADQPGQTGTGSEGPDVAGGPARTGSDADVAAPDASAGAEPELGEADQAPAEQQVVSPDADASESGSTAPPVEPVPGPEAEAPPEVAAAQPNASGSDDLVAGAASETAPGAIEQDAASESAPDGRPTAPAEPQTGAAAPPPAAPVDGSAAGPPGNVPTGAPEAQPAEVRGGAPEATAGLPPVEYRPVLPNFAAAPNVAPGGGDGNGATPPAPADGDTGGEGRSAGEQDVAALPSPPDAAPPPIDATPAAPAARSESGGPQPATSDEVGPPSATGDEAPAQPAGDGVAGPEPEVGEPDAATRGEQASTDAPDSVARPVPAADTPSGEAAGAEAQTASRTEPEAAAAEPGEAGDAPTITLQGSSAAGPDPDTAAATADLGQIAPNLSIKAAEAEADTLYVAGQAEPGTLVRVFADEELVGEVQANAEGAWLVEAQKDVPLGQVVIRADAAAGESRAPSAQVELPFIRYADGLVLEPVVAAAQGTGNAASIDAAFPQPAFVIIRRGDNLWRISKRNYGRGIRYHAIFAANRDQIRNPNRIYPGQVFVVPARDRNWEVETN